MTTAGRPVIRQRGARATAVPPKRTDDGDCAGSMTASYSIEPNKPSHRSRWLLLRRTAGPPRDLTFVVAAQKVRNCESGHRVAITEPRKAWAGRLRPKASYSRTHAADPEHSNCHSRRAEAVSRLAAINMSRKILSQLECTSGWRAARRAFEPARPTIEQWDDQRPAIPWPDRFTSNGTESAPGLTLEPHIHLRTLPL